MHINWKQFARFGLAMAGAINPSIPLAEAAIESAMKSSGTQKRAAVIEAANQAALAVDGVVGKTIVENITVQAITGQIVDLQVALHHAIADAVAAAHPPT